MNGYIVGIFMKTQQLTNNQWERIGNCNGLYEDNNIRVQMNNDVLTKLIPFVNDRVLLDIIDSATPLSFKNKEYILYNKPFNIIKYFVQVKDLPYEFIDNFLEKRFSEFTTSQQRELLGALKGSMNISELTYSDYVFKISIK